MKFETIDSAPKSKLLAPTMRSILVALMISQVSCATATYPPNQGVMILKVNPTSPLTSKLSPGDWVVEVSQQPVFKSAHIEMLFESAKLSGRQSVLVLVNNKFGLRFVAVPTAFGTSGITFADEVPPRPTK